MFYTNDYLNISMLIKAGGRSKIPVTTTVLTYTHALINHVDKVAEILHTDWLLQTTIFDLISSNNTSTNDELRIPRQQKFVFIFLWVQAYLRRQYL